MNTIFFVRHGQSQANADRIIALEDSPLTNEGRAKAKLAAAELMDKHIQAIVASPLPRAQQTAAIIAKELGINPATIQSLNELRERDLGPLKGQPKVHDSLWYFDAETDGIETREALYARMQGACQKLEELAKDGPVVAIGHAVSGFYLLQAAKHKASVGAFEPSFQAANAEVMILPD